MFMPLAAAAFCPGHAVPGDPNDPASRIEHDAAPTRQYDPYTA